VKYILFWVFSVLLITSADCYGSDLSVEGKVRKVDGSAIRGGTVIIYEYITKLGNPDVQIHAVISTDKDGRFKTSIQYLGGDLDIQLIKDRCVE
jgi:soluble P-type ATPase